MIDKIIIRGAKENNLKNVSLEIPRDKLVVFTGVSGSGKSTLAFDTIFAEGQRRYVESLSSYARMFLGQSQKPDVESIEGLSPAISIDQKSTNHNPRSTVGTITEIYDYFRLLFSRIGTPICPDCGIKIEKQTVDQIVDKILAIGESEKIILLSPVVKGQKGTHQKLLEELKKSGYIRVKIDGIMTTFDDAIELDKNKKHTIEVVVDRLVLSSEITSRLAESVESCLNLSKGMLIVEHLFRVPTQEGEVKEESRQYPMSINFSCPDCEWTIDEITPRLFSFNSPFGACPDCSGLGFTMDIDEKIIMKNSEKSINEGAFNVSGWNAEKGSIASTYFYNLSRMYGINLNIPIKDLPREHIDIILYGNRGEKMQMTMQGSKFTGTYNASFEGLIPNLSRRYKETTSEFIKWEI